MSTQYDVDDLRLECFREARTYFAGYSVNTDELLELAAKIEAYVLGKTAPKRKQRAKPRRKAKK